MPSSSGLAAPKTSVAAPCSTVFFPPSGSMIVSPFSSTRPWDWSYVLVQVGPEDAINWRGMLPDLIFPLDRSWLLSMLWDDGWTCIGGPTTLVDGLATDRLINARRVERGDDPTPPSFIPS